MREDSRDVLAHIHDVEIQVRCAVPILRKWYVYGEETHSRTKLQEVKSGR